MLFLGFNGLVDFFTTPGTFNRHKFLERCNGLATCNKQVKHINVYPGTHSVLIMDGASIHCSPEIVNHLRALGIMIIYLPAYCPFFNPEEAQAELCRESKEGYDVEVAKAMQSFANFDFRGVFA